MRCETLYLIIAPERISFLRFLLEGYDGLALLSTVDAKTGQVCLRFPGPRYRELMAFLSAVAGNLVKHDKQD